MGIKRLIDTGLWEDEKVETFTPEEKYFWLFLLTNPKTTMLGIYYITKKQISYYSGYDGESVDKLLKRFEIDYQMIKCSDNEIAIKNFLKRSVNAGGKPIEDMLKADIKSVKDKVLINWVIANLNLDEVNETVKNVINDYIYTNNLNIKELNNTLNINSNSNRYIYSDSLTTRERLVDDSSKTDTNKKPKKTSFIKPTIEEIQDYINEKSYEYVDAEEFYYFYDAKGWLVGKDKMKDWKSSVAGWNARNKNKKKENTGNYQPKEQIVYKYTNQFQTEKKASSPKDYGLKYDIDEVKVLAQKKKDNGDPRPLDEIEESIFWGHEDGE